MPLKRRIVLDDAEINSPPESQQPEQSLRSIQGLRTATAVRGMEQEQEIKIMKLLNAGAISVNEARNAFGLNPVEESFETKLAQAIKKHDPAGMQFTDFNEFLDEIKGTK